MPEDHTLALVSQIVALQARVDGLTAIVHILAMKAGSDSEKFRDGLRTMTSAAHQLRLDKIEELSPTMAAKIDQREGIPDLDFELMKQLGFSE